MDHQVMPNYRSKPIHTFSFIQKAIINSAITHLSKVFTLQRHENENLADFISAEPVSKR